MTNRTTLLEVAILMMLAVGAMIFGYEPTHTAQASMSTPQSKLVDVVPLSVSNIADITNLQDNLEVKAVKNNETIYKVKSKYGAPHYKSLPLPQKDTDWDSYKSLIVQAAKYSDVDPVIMSTMAAIETNFTSTSKNKKSSASGLFQFINGTWKVTADKYGEKYGISSKTSRLDPRANALMGAEYLKENERYLVQRLNRPVTASELYMAHLLGAGGAVSIIKANPNKLAANVRPDSASSNKNLFYGKSGKKFKAYTVYEFKQNIRKTVRQKADLYSADALAYSEFMQGTKQIKPMAVNYKPSINFS